MIASRLMILCGSCVCKEGFWNIHGFSRGIFYTMYSEYMAGAKVGVHGKDQDEKLHCTLHKINKNYPKEMFKADAAFS